MRKDAEDIKNVEIKKKAEVDLKNWSVICFLDGKSLRLMS